MTRKRSALPSNSSSPPNHVPARSAPFKPRIARWPPSFPRSGASVMKSSIDSPANFSPTSVLLLEWKSRQARLDPDAFAEFAFTDSSGRALRQAAVHRELQRFLGAHARALVELPRDHGKTMQVCLRVLWELGLQPDLRVKFVCASEALALERGRFLRSAIAQNARVPMVFPSLLP